MNGPVSRRSFLSSTAIAGLGLSAAGAGSLLAGCAAPEAGRQEAANGHSATQPEPRRVTLLHFTDTHAQLETHPEYLPGANPEIQMAGGYARLKTAIRQEQANCHAPCFLLDGGDEFQGSGPAAWSEGQVILDRLDLVLKPEGGVASHDYREIPILQSRYAEDPQMKALVDRSLAPHRRRMGERVGKTGTLLMRYDVLETTADDFITDAVREAAQADIGLSNGFRFGVPIPPENITQADLWNLLPMDARMKIGWVSGRELRDYLENELELVFSKDPWKLNGGWGPRASGLTMRFDARAPKGRRLISVQVGGREVEDERHYTIAGCEREGEPVDVICRHKGTHEARVLPLSVHEALQSYLKVHPLIRPRREGREVAADLPRVVFSQDAVLAGGNLADAPTTPHGLPPG